MLRLSTHRSFSTSFSSPTGPSGHTRLLHGRSGQTLGSKTVKPRRHVKIMEVSPRDGLQNEPEILSTSLKIDLIARLMDLKLKSIEIGSFVSPKWVPQMATTPEVISGLGSKRDSKLSGVTFSCLVPNLKGFEQLENSNFASTPLLTPVVDEIALFASATEAFSKANLNSSISDSIRKMSEVAARAKERGMAIRGYISCAFGCPYQGRVDPNNVAFVTRELFDIGCYEVAISDTIGVGVPHQVEECLNHLSRLGVNPEQLGIHCHDTFGTGLSNILAAVSMGVQTVDSSIGGIGGCPYSPGATGNIATEDVVYALESSGYDTGVIPSSLTSNSEFAHYPDLLSQLEPLARTGDWINCQLGRDNSSRVGKAILARALRDINRKEKTQ